MKNILSKFSFKNAILKGTLILTISGITCRAIGFFFRVYMTHLIGSEGMGIYQLIIPFAGVVYAACIAGICTGISRFTAESVHSSRWMIAGSVLSIPLSIICSLIFWKYAELISIRILLNPDCVSPLRTLALSFPFAAAHSCIGAYFLGIKKVTIPAVSQLIEQFVRIGSIILVSLFLHQAGRPFTVSMILFGNLIGDIAATIYNFICFHFYKKNLESKKLHLLNQIRRMTTYSLPLTMNRVLMQLLASGEAVLIPVQLMLYGHDQTAAMSLYGILAGMALPFINFPSAITNALSVMLLPEISEAQSKNDIKKIASIIRQTIQLCLIMGLFFTLLFILIGSRLSVFMFNNDTVGIYVSILAWICPFQYMAVTLGSILNGLGKTTSTCVVNIAGILIRILFLMLLTPRIGVSGCLYGLLCGQIFVCAAHFLQLRHMYQL